MTNAKDSKINEKQIAQPVTLSESIKVPRQMGIKIELDKSIQELDESDIVYLNQILTRHGAICLVKQDLSTYDLIAFVKKWGMIVEQISPDLTYYDNIGPILTGVGNVRVDGSIIDQYKHGEMWHHDGTFWKPGDNYMATFLHAKILPNIGGATAFLDTQTAYQLLSDDTKTCLNNCVFTADINKSEAKEHHDHIPPVTHRTVTIHPISKIPALYIANSPAKIRNERNQEIIMEPEQLISLVESLVIPVEHSWHTGDVLIFDNLQLLHRSVGGYGNLPRLLHRCQARLSCNDRQLTTS